jgi:hypothetical protein
MKRTESKMRECSLISLTTDALPRSSARARASLQARVSRIDKSEIPGKTIAEAPM